MNEKITGDALDQLKNLIQSKRIAARKTPPEEYVLLNSVVEELTALRTKVAQFTILNKISNGVEESGELVIEKLKKDKQEAIELIKILLPNTSVFDKPVRAKVKDFFERNKDE